jgi:SH3-like domain-containing protein
MAPQIPEKIPVSHNSSPSCDSSLVLTYFSKCTTPIEFVQELRAAHQALDQDETEDNWEKMGLALKRLAAVTKGGAYKLESEFPAGMKGLADEIVRCVR